MYGNTILEGRRSEEERLGRFGLTHSEWGVEEKINKIWYVYEGEQESGDKLINVQIRSRRII